MNDLDRSIEEVRDPYGTQARLERFAGLLDGYGRHTSIEALDSRVLEVEGRQMRQHADFSRRIQELERQVRDLQYFLKGIVFIGVLVWALNEYGEENARSVGWFIFAGYLVYVGLLLVRGAYRRATRNPEPNAAD